jgi:O-antigen ligase
MELPALPIAMLLIMLRAFTDSWVGTADSRAGSSINLSSLVAVGLIVLATGAFLRRLQAPRGVALAALAVIFWTGVAIHFEGQSLLAVREGIRELSIIAVAVIVLNSPPIEIGRLTRLVQWAGLIPALLAVYQFASGTGLVVGGLHRAQGTFIHPNSAAVYFAIPLILSVVAFLGHQARVFDGWMTLVYALAALGTGSLGGLLSILVGMLVLVMFNGTRLAGKIGMLLGAVALIIAFLATPLGSSRVSTVFDAPITTNVVRGHSNDSLEWRFYNWGTLLPEWRQHPIAGEGLGATTTGTTVTGTIPHNEYLRYLVETGLAGLILLASGVIALLARMLRLLRRGTSLRATGLAGVAILVTLMINAGASNTLLYTPAAYQAALVLTAIITATRASKSIIDPGSIKRSHRLGAGRESLALRRPSAGTANP